MAVFGCGAVGLSVIQVVTTDLVCVRACVRVRAGEGVVVYGCGAVGLSSTGDMI